MNKATPINFPQTGPTIIASPAASHDSLVDVKAILAAVRRRIWLIVTAFLIVFSSVVVVTFQATPIYSSTTRVLLDTRELRIVDAQSVLQELTPSTAIIDTEVQIVTSQVLLEKVVDRLKLTERPEFNPFIREPSTMDRWKASFSGFVRSITGGEEPGSFSELPDDVRERIMREVAVAILGSKVSVGRVGPTYMINITGHSEDRALAAEIANTVADEYRVAQLDAKLEATRRANQWLDERLGALKEEVNTKEEAVAAYRDEVGLAVVGDRTLTEQQISDLQAQKIIREAELADALARLTNVRTQLDNGVSPDSIGEVLGSPTVVSLKGALSDTRRKKADLETRYGPMHPEVQSVLEEEAGINDQIRAEVDRIISNLESEVSIARQRIASLNANISSARNTLSMNSRARVRLDQLEREAEASRTLYEEFLARFKETNQSEDLQRADARIIAVARRPARPSSPKKTLNVIIAIMFGGVVAGGLALLAELLDNHIATGEEVERLFSVPSIGAIPLLPNLNVFGKPKISPADYLVENPLSAFAESIRNLRASVIFADLDQAAKTVSISSSLPDEGKTSLVYCLGRMSAMSGAKTVIIDGDFRRRQLTETVGVEPKYGLIEHLFGEVTLEEALFVDEATGLDVLPLTDARNTPRDVFGSRAFDRLLEDLKGRYDLIVIDTGPLLLMAESRVLASKVDQVIVAAKWRSTNRQSLSQSLSILREFNANIAGVVLTFVDMRRRRHHNYGSTNYKAYSRYYTDG